MGKKVSIAKTKYIIKQFTKDTKELVNIYDSVQDVVDKNPSYKKHNIYSACSGAKSTIYGFIWTKEF